MPVVAEERFSANRTKRSFVTLPPASSGPHGDNFDRSAKRVRWHYLPHLAVSFGLKKAPSLSFVSPCEISLFFAVVHLRLSAFICGSYQFNCVDVDGGFVRGAGVEAEVEYRPAPAGVLGHLEYVIVEPAVALQRHRFPGYRGR